MAVRVHAEKAVSAEEEQELPVLGHKSGRLELRTARTDFFLLERVVNRG